MGYAGSAAMTYESILYVSAARVLAIQVLQAGVVVASTGASTGGDLLQQAGEPATGHGRSENDDNDGVAPRGGYLLTSLAVLAIVKAWDVGMYDPPRTDCAKWLGEVYDVCERYEIPAKQRARCASHRMRADCKEAVHAAGCYNMTWDKFAAWLRRYDGKFYVLMLLYTSRADKLIRCGEKESRSPKGFALY